MFIWCLIHRTSTYLQINLQFYNFLALRVNYIIFVSFHSNHVYASQLFSVTQHYYWVDLAVTKIYFLSTFSQLGFWIRYVSIQTEISLFLDKLGKRLRSVSHLPLQSYTKGRFFRSVSYTVSCNALFQLPINLWLLGSVADVGDLVKVILASVINYCWFAFYCFDWDLSLCHYSSHWTTFQ